MEEVVGHEANMMITAIRRITVKVSIQNIGFFIASFSKSINKCTTYL